MIYPTELFAEKSIIENCTIEITNQCHFSCLHCDYPKKRKGDFLRLDLVDAIADQLLELGTFRVTISGGEPFEHPQIVEIIEIFIRKSFYVRVITNGYLINEDQINRLGSYSRLEIVFSLLGTNDVHDAITGVKGSFEKIDAAISMLKLFKCKKSFQSCVLRNNFHNLNELIAYAESVDTSQKLDPFITNTLSNSHIPLLRLSNDELKEYYIRYTNICKAASKVVQEQELIRLKSCDCGVGKSAVTITCNGDLLPCGNIRKSLGNVNDLSIKSIWENSEYIKMLRNRTELDRPECVNCDMKTLCSRCLAIAITEHGDWQCSPKECCRHMQCLREVVQS